MEAPRETAIGDLPVLRKARSALDDDYLEISDPSKQESYLIHAMA
jgi:hypothetical protein